VDVGPQTEQGPLSVGLIDPAPNTVLTATPLSLLLEFNHPILPESLIFGDLVVYQIGAEGNQPIRSALTL
jgi:hypothetical protein